MANGPVDKAQPAHQQSTIRTDPEPRVDGAKLSGWRGLGIAAGSGLALGLMLGILLGRATVAPAEIAREQTAKKATARPQTEKVPKAAPANPAGAYIMDLGRPPQVNEVVVGFAREPLGKRKVARLEGPEASVQLPFTPVKGKTYALTAVARFEGKGEARLQPSLGDKTLSEWQLVEGWHFFGSLLAPEAFAAGADTVAIRLSRLGTGGGVHLDSISIVPVDETLELTVGADSRGRLVDGFSGPSGQSIWSEGLRSVLGIALIPADTAYDLSLRASAFHPLAPLSVKLIVNGVQAGNVTLSKQVENVSLVIPRGALRPGANELILEPAQAGQPSKVNPASKDQRLLAMRFYSLALTPKR